MAKAQRKIEQGDIGTVILIVVIVAIIGVLGWVFWQKMADKSTDTTTPVSDAKSDETPAAAELALSGWGVAMPKSDSLDGVAVKKTVLDTTSIDMYVVTVDESVLFGDDAKTDTQELGRVLRHKAADKVDMSDANSHTYGEYAKGEVKDDDRMSPGTMVMVGDYVYEYSSRQAAAYEGTTDAEVAADKKLDTLARQTFVEAFKQLHEQK